MTHGGKFHALLSTARVANVPSVWGSVGLGVILGGVVEAPLDSWLPAWWLLGTAATLLYLGGNFLNDWHDRGWDALRRPERALPRGLFRPGTYRVLALASILLGLGTAWLAGPGAVGAATAIAGAIGLYTWIHKRSAWAVLPMGFCRAMLPVLGALGAMGGFSPEKPGHTVALRLAALAGLALWLYIAGLSLEARNESQANPSRGLQRLARVLLLVVPLPALLACREVGLGVWWFAGLLPYAWWMLRAPRGSGPAIGARVSHLLAGIPWVDAILIVPLTLAVAVESGRWFVALVPLALVAGLVAAGRLLQRVAPAT